MSTILTNLLLGRAFTCVVLVFGILGVFPMSPSEESLSAEWLLGGGGGGGLQGVRGEAKVSGWEGVSKSEVIRGNHTGQQVST